jgi:hypothetical protein
MTKRKDLRETHLGSGPAAGEFTTPQLYAEGNEREKPSDNILDEKAGGQNEVRSFDNIRTATVEPEVFNQEGDQSSHMLSPSSAGISIRFSAPSYNEGQGLDSHQASSRQFKRKHD